jgi:hypothetical protein
MSVMLDIVGAAVLVGMLMLTVMNININMNAETYRTATEFHTQTEMIQLARIFEFDVYKAGYGVAKPAIIAADSSHLKFRTNLLNVAGARDSVEYILGTPVTTSPNPNDKHLLRIENVSTVSISYSVTRFKLMYYNGRDSVMATPVTGALLDSIRSIRIFLSLESPSLIDGSYAGANYEKLIYPRNLQQ